MGNTFGRYLKITSFGESHGPAAGAVIDGFPAGIYIDEVKLQNYIARRRPGQKNTTSRSEPDKAQILSGIFEGKTLGTPIAVIVKNTDCRSRDYENLRRIYRPSHADYTWQLKYGHRDYRGGGRASGRETLSRVIAGGFAEQLLQQWSEARGMPAPQIVSWTESLGAVSTNVSEDVFKSNLETLTREHIDSLPFKCPYENLHAQMEEYMQTLKKSGNSCGGCAAFAVRNVPAGLGDPVFDRLDSAIAQAVMSIPSVKGIEIGSGFKLAGMEGSSANDTLENIEGKVRVSGIHSGGMWGGISLGSTIWGKAAFKPAPSISLKQKTLNDRLEDTEICIGGRHDPCTVLRGETVIEAMLALVLADCLLADLSCRL